MIYIIKVICRLSFLLSSSTAN